MISPRFLQPCAFAQDMCENPGGTYRVIYVARFAEAIYVLHAFQKKTQKTSQADLDLAKQRYRLAHEFAAGVKRG